jgi:CheR methyltransferase-like protein
LDAEQLSDRRADRTEDLEIRPLLEALFQKYHFDFRGYAIASLKRRLKRGREHFGFVTISAIQNRLLHDATMFPSSADPTVQVSEILSNRAPPPPREREFAARVADAETQLAHQIRAC